MNDIVSKMKTPEECAILEKNAMDRGREDIALAARKRQVQLRALKYGAQTDVERECLEAIFAYEQSLSTRNGRKTRESRTWGMIERHGIIPAVERAVNRKEETAGYTVLVDMGLEEYAFEAVILKHPELFSHEVVAISRERVAHHADQSAVGDTPESPC